MVKNSDALCIWQVRKQIAKMQPLSRPSGRKISLIFGKNFLHLFYISCQWKAAIRKSIGRSWVLKSRLQFAEDGLLCSESNHEKTESSASLQANLQANLHNFLADPRTTSIIVMKPLPFLIGLLFVQAVFGTKKNMNFLNCECKPPENLYRIVGGELFIHWALVTEL